MSELQPLPTAITDICRAHFGRYVAPRGTWQPPNRCDSCPLRTPCLANGAAPAHTIEQLHASRQLFIDDAQLLMQRQGAGA